MRMLNDFQNMNLSGDSLDICDVGNFTFLKNLHSDLFACSDVAAEFDFAESALTKRLRDAVRADLKSLLFHFCDQVER